MTGFKPALGIVCACLLLAGCAKLGMKGDGNSRAGARSGGDRDAQQIVEVMRRAADWQLANLPEQTVVNNQPRKIEDNGWIRAAFFTGVMAAHRATGDQKYLNAAIDWGKRNGWNRASRPRHGDDFCCGQTYIEIYEITKDEGILAPMKAAMDPIVEDPMRGPIVGWKNETNWAWCDALFMAPPTFAKMSRATGDPKYLEAMNVMWWDTTDYLYSDPYDLYYRDGTYLPTANPVRLEKNGKPMFWSRGNGWVIAGLARVLQVMPKDYKDRPRYEQLFKDMSASLLKLQQPDGFWRSSLLDPESYPTPETSGTAFFTYGLAWGINNGYLDAATYQPAVEKGWDALVKCVEPSGKLTWVQLVGKEPAKVNQNDTVEYAVGAFLLAGSEVMKLK